MINLLGLDGPALAEYVGAMGEKPFRARQLMRWIHQFGENDFSAMTDLSRDFRARLAGVAEVATPRVLRDSTASDGTRKWLLDVGASNAIETVFIPEEHRGTLCVSSQAGCALECAFCSTGRQGFNRNLGTAEIVGQLWWATRALRAPDARPRVAGFDGDSLPEGEEAPDRPISNVVMMGMGEPLANYDNVVAALRLMLDDRAYGLSRRRLTLSTSGLVSAMDRLREDCPVALAVSLHAPTDDLRDRLVPVNRKWPLRDLMAACRRYIEKAPRDFVTFEYVMLDGVNDTPAHARALVELVSDVPCKMNLIPFNPFPESGFRRSPAGAVQAFRDVLMVAGLVTTVRKTRGSDIDAACGQLAGQVQDRTRRTLRRSPEVH